MSNIEKIQSVSNLIKACWLTGAAFKADHILLADKNKLNITFDENFWILENCKIPKDSSVKKITHYLLTTMCKINLKKLDHTFI